MSWRIVRLTLLAASLWYLGAHWHEAFASEQRALFVYDLNAPAIEVPAKWAERADSIVQCESRWDTNAVGSLGELGLLQIHPIHFPQMQTMGLNPFSEHDRMVYAVWKWEQDGESWAAWSCGR